MKKFVWCIISQQLFDDRAELWFDVIQLYQFIKIMTHYSVVIMSTMTFQITIVYNRLVRRRSNKTSIFRVTGLFEGNSLVNSKHKGPVTRKMFPIDDVTRQHININPMWFEMATFNLLFIANDDNSKYITPHTDAWMYDIQHILWQLSDQPRGEI